jgi:hypothetical protein
MIDIRIPVTESKFENDANLSIDNFKLRYAGMLSTKDNLAYLRLVRAGLEQTKLYGHEVIDFTLKYEYINSLLLSFLDKIPPFASEFRELKL